MSHNEAEEFMLAEGREVMRRLLQGYFDLRGEDDAGMAVMGQDCVLRYVSTIESEPDLLVVCVRIAGG